MRALIVSDIHGNTDALAALDAHLSAASWTPDIVVALGDFVDYGPDPEGAVQWAQEHHTIAVSGNHDYAMATGRSCRSSARFHPYAVATREYFRARLDARILRWLGDLALLQHLQTPADWLLAHATVRDPLFEYLAATASDSEWEAAIADAPKSVGAVLVGHSHEPFARRIGQRWVVNPGSLGLPKDGDPRASFATFEDGVFRLHRIAYNVERAAMRLCALALPAHVTWPLADVIRTGSIAALPAFPDRVNR